MSELRELTKESLVIDPQQWCSEIETFIKQKLLNPTRTGF
jgi:hypothetical protein